MPHATAVRFLYNELIRLLFAHFQAVSWGIRQMYETLLAKEHSQSSCLGYGEEISHEIVADPASQQT